MKIDNGMQRKYLAAIEQAAAFAKKWIQKHPEKTPRFTIPSVFVIGNLDALGRKCISNR